VFFWAEYWLFDEELGGVEGTTGDHIYHIKI
jgi:hypothetical protein